MKLLLLKMFILFNYYLYYLVIILNTIYWIMEIISNVSYIYFDGSEGIIDVFSDILFA